MTIPEDFGEIRWIYSTSVFYEWVKCFCVQGQTAVGLSRRISFGRVTPASERDYDSQTQESGAQLPPKIRQRIPFDLPKEAGKVCSKRFQAASQL